MELNLILLAFQIVLIYPIVQIIMHTRAILALSRVIKSCQEQLAFIDALRKDLNNDQAPRN